MKFLVLVEGFGFAADLDRKRQNVGFFASRIVQAQDVEQIDQTHLFEGLYNELEANGVLRSETSGIRISEVRECTDAYLEEPTGFSFFVES